MFNTVLETIKKYNMIQENDFIVVGVSGGADSVSLLHILYLLSHNINIKIMVVHVNHGLRGEDANKDEMFVNTLCSKYNVVFKSFKYNIKEEAKKLSVTEEEAGRIIRYDSFRKTADEYNANKIAVAHNMNDNAETILMRICRGTGIKGLGGITPVFENIIRPLINCKRKEIEKYCIDNNLSYRNDYTNNIDIYTRNKIRLNLIPWIENNLNSNVVNTLSKMSLIMKEENVYLDKLALEAFNKCIVEDEKKTLLKISELEKLDDVIKRRVIRIAYTKYSGFIHNMSYEHINMVLSLLQKPTGKTINLPHNLKASRRYDYIYIYRGCKIIDSFKYNICIDKFIYIEQIQKYVTLSPQKINNATLVNTYTIVFDYDKIYNTLQIRTRCQGDKIYLKGINKNKKIKDFFIDLKIPRDLRDNIPLIADGSNVLWIMGYRISDFYKADLNTKNKIYLQIWEDKK